MFFEQVRFGKLATLENALKVCAQEFLDIEESRYEEEIKRRGIDIFLLDGRARVTDPTYPYNRTSYKFSYIKVGSVRSCKLHEYFFWVSSTFDL